jgi:hypothetical protein
LKGKNWERQEKGFGKGTIGSSHSQTLSHQEDFKCSYLIKGKGIILEWKGLPRDHIIASFLSFLPTLVKRR